MVRGEAPEETAELTRFVMDCTDYCSQSPQALSVDNTTYNSATISFRSESQAGEVVYSTEAGFDPGTATPTSVSYEALAAKESPWGGIPNNASLTVNGLDPLTKYYVRVRNVCTGGEGISRWSDPVEVVTGSRYDGPTIVSTDPVNSRSEKISFENGGESTKVNLYYRAKVQGTPVSDDAIQSMGSGKGEGFEKGSWGENIWASGSEKPYSNIPAGELGIPEDDWAEKSVKLRRSHECTHFFTKQTYGIEIPYWETSLAECIGSLLGTD